MVVAPPPRRRTRPGLQASREQAAPVERARLAPLLERLPPQTEEITSVQLAPMPLPIRQARYRNRHTGLLGDDGLRTRRLPHTCPRLNRAIHHRTDVAQVQPPWRQQPGRRALRLPAQVRHAHRERPVEYDAAAQ